MAVTGRCREAQGALDGDVAGVTLGLDNATLTALVSSILVNALSCISCSKQKIASFSMPRMYT